VIDLVTLSLVNVALLLASAGLGVAAAVAVAAIMLARFAPKSTKTE